MWLLFQLVQDRKYHKIKRRTDSLFQVRKRSMSASTKGEDAELKAYRTSTESLLQQNSSAASLLHKRHHHQRSSTDSSLFQRQSSYASSLAESDISMSNNTMSRGDSEAKLIATPELATIVGKKKKLERTTSTRRSLEHLAIDDI
mmetsp:Transcript_26150/g.46408  ORF Transcript_26150/g.46408 Transcript_26150/m.46408 type:complete len:145 (+) Transcript_26150:436-870(+)